MAKHTPGPWTDHAGAIDARYLSGVGEVRLIRRDGENDNRYVAMASLDAMGFDNLPIKTTPEERDANARLIAAAPELLDALKMITAVLIAGGYDPDSRGVAECRAAISKATAS